MIGKPYYEEIREQYPDDMISLLQIDENDDWNLRFVDCGMVCFMIGTYLPVGTNKNNKNTLPSIHSLGEYAV